MTRYARTVAVDTVAIAEECDVSVTWVTDENQTDSLFRTETEVPNRSLATKANA